MKAKIVLISSGQPSLNPRLVKEADALATNGYDVTVLYAYWNDWGTKLDGQLLEPKKWKALRVGGDPVHKPFTYFISRIINKLAKSVSQKTGLINYFSELAMARSSVFLIRETKKHKADLYIAHNLGALAAAAKAAKKQNAKYGFDAEDFHRQEVSNNAGSFSFKIAKYLEDKYLNKADYITASSPQIADKYRQLYPGKEPFVILNVFPKNSNPPEPVINETNPLKLFWFSQTIGNGRGLEEIFDASGILKDVNLELHLLGDLPEGSFKDFLLNMTTSSALKIFIYPPIPSEQITAFASKFDIGLAIETGTILNRDICLTNKIFTYVNAGLAIIASDTTAQRDFIEHHPAIGKVYSKTNTSALADVLKYFSENKNALQKAREAALALAQSTLNWETESVKFLNLINQNLQDQS